MKTLLILLVSLPALAAPVDNLLGAREHVITAAEVKALGERPDRILIGVASNARTSRLKRIRAIIALRHAPSVEALAFLRDVLATEGQATSGADVLDVAAALGSLGGAATLSEVLPFVTHRAVEVRHAAVSVLGLLPLPEAESALRARFYVERDPGVRDACARALRAFSR